MRRLIRWARALTFTSCIWMFSLGVLDQPGSVAPTLLPHDAELMRWAVTQGGLLVVVLLLVWSYRRDFTRALDLEKTRADQAMELMTKATVALTTHSETMRLHTASVAQLTEAVKLCKLVQEVLHTRIEG